MVTRAASPGRARMPASRGTTAGYVDQGRAGDPMCVEPRGPGPSAWGTAGGPASGRVAVYSDHAMKVVLRNQGREVELRGRRRVRELLAELGVLPDTVLVIRGRELLTIDEVVADEDVVELRPVISGGSA
jgi:sulfur carrier protein